MDSITQAALGAGVATLCVSPRHRRKALLAGAVLGTLPDLDVLIDYGDAVSNFTYHRGFSHSLFVLPPFALTVWLALLPWWAPVRESPRPWLLAIMLALTTHPLLDAHTAYGTQLLWPLQSPPVMWSTIFIIDPLYTLPLLVGAFAIAIVPTRRLGRIFLVAGVALSTTYLAWTWGAKTLVEREARQALVALHLESASVFSVPTPFNTLLWRIVVLTDEGFLEGFDSLLIDEGPMKFQSHLSDRQALEQAGHIWAVQRLRWFASDFVKAEIDAGRLIVSDLRMGQEPRYVFRHAVAVRANPRWQAIPPEQVFTLFDSGDLTRVWERLYTH